MKKVFLLFAFVAVYGVSMAMSGSSVNAVDNSQVTVVTDMYDNNVVAPETEKAKEAKAAKSEAKSEGCATAKSEGCGTAKSAGCGDKAKSASAEKK